MTILSAVCIAKSEHPDCDKTLSTVECTYPRWIHAEGKTHRMLAIGEDDAPEYRTPSLMDDHNLSRNASSSRAIPVKRMINAIIEHPAIPLFWGQNQKGMQAGEEINTPIMINSYVKEGIYFVGYSLEITREEAWLRARDQAIESALAFEKAGYSKQIINRLLEPFSHIKVVVTATEWTNFFGLRIHCDAEPHIRMLAEAIRNAIDDAEAVRLPYGAWHVPYVTTRDNHSALRRNTGRGLSYWMDLRKVSVARCARTSYRTHDDRQPEFDEDIALHDRIMGNIPLHASPAEHQGTPDPTIGQKSWAHPELHGNFKGFQQNRKTYAGEHIYG